MIDSGTNGKRILLVEDETAICELCQRVLTDEGYELDTTVNGKLGQDMIEEQQYNLYLFDIKLPVLNGQELYQWLQVKHPQLVNLVIFTTGSVTDPDTLTFIEQTGRPLLPKPFTPNELIAIVNESLKEAGR